MTAYHPILVRVMAVVSAMQHGFGLFLLDTGTTQWKGGFVTATHRQDRVKQTSGWKNVDGDDAKIRPLGVMICGSSQASAFRNLKNA